MSKKTKTAVTGICSFVLFVAAIFMIVSLLLASAHDKTLLDEWKSWVQVEEQKPEDDQTEEDDKTENEQENKTETDIQDGTEVTIQI